MDAVRTWIIGICAAAVAASIARIITPSGGVQRTMKIISAVFMLCIVTSPLIGEISFDFSKELDAVSIPQSSELSDTVMQQTEVYTQSQLKSLMESYLKKYGIERARISIIMEREQDMRISIVRAEAGVSEEYMSLVPEAKKNIEQETGIEIIFYSYNDD